MNDNEVVTQQHVRGSPARAVVSYVRRALGSAAARDLLTEAAARHGHDADPDEWLANWMPAEAVIDLAALAGHMCGDPAIGRRAGEEGMRTLRERGIADFLHAAGSVDAALALFIDGANKTSDGRTHGLTDSGPNRATMTARYAPTGKPATFFCDYLAGFLSGVPELFGCFGIVTEPRCELRGHDHCRYELRWERPAADRSEADDGIDASRERSVGLFERFEQLHLMATELAGAQDIDTLLERITEQASTAVKAPRHVLAVRTHGHGQLRIHQRGFPPDQVDEFVARLLADDLDDHRAHLVVDVASPGRWYGRMAAVYPERATVNDLERRLMLAYARHAVAALESVEALESARADRDTAQALLTLAASLAEVGTRRDVARRLAATVPAVAASDRADVWLWDAEAEGMRLEARYPEGDETQLADLFIAASENPELLAQISSPVPLVVRRSEAGPVPGRLMDWSGIGRSAIVPIRSRGEFLGVVHAGFVDEDPARDHRDDETALLERLRGMADQAATALDNAILLERLREQSLHDALTGLPNRVLLEERATQALLMSGRSLSPVSVLFIDLDRFKHVNDTLGHAAGDDLICEAGRRIGAELRATDTLGRFGGDEFVVLLPHTGVDGARTVGQAIIDALARPFALGSETVFVSCSVGIAAAPMHGGDYDSLLRFADAAMYAAKQAGRATLAVHAHSHHADGAYRLQLEQDLHRALDRGELEVVYQPQVDLRTAAIVGVEALLRWNHPQLGRLDPLEFLGVADESDLIVEIDAWVHRTAIQQVARWQRPGAPLRLAVNVAGRTVRHPDFVRHLRTLMTEFDLDPALVELELNDHAVRDWDDLTGLLAPARTLGVRLAIDDFGTGSSILAQLDRCPVDTVKVDGSFLDAITAAGAAPMMDALLFTAAGLGLDVVAEGVETEAQAAYLLRHGCVRGQGHRFAPALSAEELGPLLGTVADHAIPAADTSS